MLNTTLKLVKAALRADHTLTPAERAKLLMQAHNGSPAIHPPSPNEPRLIRRAEVARRLSCSLRTVDKLAANGVLLKRTLPNRKRASGFLEADVTALITRKEGSV